MKEKLTRNIGLKILSIILAVLLWLIITNVIDPITQKNFSDIQVDVLNGDKISALNEVYDIIEGATIDFTAAAKRSIIDGLNRNDFYVSADLSKLSDLNTVTINIKYLGSDSDRVKITNGLNQVMKINLEDKITKQYNVEVEQTGKLAKGYYVYEKKTNALINISGPKSKIEKIARVVVDVDVTGYTKSFDSMEVPKVLDAKGKEIDQSNLILSNTYIRVDVSIYKTKKIALTMEPIGTPANGYVVTGYDNAPKEIEIAAADSILSSINELKVTQKVDGATSNIEKEINIQEQLTEQYPGVYLVDDNKNTTISITIEKPGTKEISILPSDIKVKDIPSSLKLEYLTTVPITLKLSGPADEIKDLSIEDIDPYIDLSNYSSGTYRVHVSADLAENITLVESPILDILLTKQ